MKNRYWLVSLCILFACFATAQDTCLPVYALPVKKIDIGDGTTIGYVEKGKGQVLLFVHGLGGNISHWIKNIEGLSKNYRCIAVDLPGYGYSVYSGAAKNNQLDFYAGCIKAFAEKMKIERFTLIGHSMGGQVAVIAALAYPQKIEKLVLVNPAGLETFSANEASLLKNFTTVSFFQKQDEAAIRTSFGNNFVNQLPDVEKLIQYRLQQKRCPNADAYFETVVKGVYGMLDHPVKNDLSNIKQKVLVVFGEDDRLIPNKLLHPALTNTDIQKVATENIPNVSVVIIPDTGHMLPFERPDLCNSTIQYFLK